MRTFKETKNLGFSTLQYYEFLDEYIIKIG